jgi:hypothetical protein
VIGHGQFVEKKCKFVVRLSAFSLSVAIDALFEIFDALLGLVLINALLADEEIGRASLAVVFVHH